MDEVSGGKEAPSEKSGERPRQPRGGMEEFKQENQLPRQGQESLPEDLRPAPGAAQQVTQIR